MPANPKIRLDALLVERGLCDSRTQAQALVLAGKVRTGTTILDKPGRSVPFDLELVLEEPPPYVSRAGEKLAGFLDEGGFDPNGCHILDVGASTGGFTDCLLQRGALTATCVDVGHGQLHHKLRIDPRVTNCEKLHAARLPETKLPRETYDWIVMDLSFISLRRILEAVWPRLGESGLLIALVKPQFEATREEANREKGIIRDDGVRQRVLQEVIDFALEHLPAAQMERIAESTLSGTDGNREFLIALRKNQIGDTQ